MIDPIREDLIFLSVAPRHYPGGAGGKKVHVSRVYRDIHDGCRGVFLEAVRTPKLATSREAIARFFLRLGELDRGVRPGIPRSLRSAPADPRVEEALDGLGL
ncbi:MAG: hypothetical protein JWN86_1685 [Planctomycetota bacterium]|nr:hypothetical protein [Planctomycetota bacterium]